ncbi:MAG: type II secretion system GspH family protein [Sulfuricella denitrificans]|nr:type II secretion system GspH family protein [Sulfuricella denitrificans]
MFCRERGFTYLVLLAVVAAMGVALAATGEVWHTVLKREKEQELLFIGDQFRRAFNLYNLHTPGNARRYPMNLEDLLRDPRAPGVQRYLRKIYADPMTGGTVWGLIRGPNGEIYGVHSLSEEAPLKKAGFSLAEAKFEGRKKYSEWVFMYDQGQVSGGFLKKP